MELRADAAQRVIIIVRDTGIGIPAEMDVRNAVTLGLQLVYTLTEQLNGSLELESHEGTTFTLIFTL
jgi:two-component sensor histidine kinase